VRACQLRSEQRIRMAALALAADKLADKPAAPPPSWAREADHKTATSVGFNAGAFTARF
jgi:hypothetical protein